METIEREHFRLQNVVEKLVYSVAPAWRRRRPGGTFLIEKIHPKGLWRPFHSQEDGNLLDLPRWDIAQMVFFLSFCSGFLFNDSRGGRGFFETPEADKLFLTLSLTS